ncbi:MAG: 5'-nucleotidase C-terminal domain-containing protein [Flavobacteriales bacterium]
MIIESARTLFLLAIICIVSHGCKSKSYISNEPETQVIAMDDQIKTNAHPSALLIKPYKKALDSLMALQVAQSSMPLTKTLPESTLGNLITDLLKYHFEKTSGIVLHGLILNQGGLRIELPQGTITRSMVFELMPFDNELVIFNMKGEDLINILNHIADKGGMPISGIRMGIADKKAVQVEIAGRPISLNENYLIATSDYLFGGGDKFNFSKSSNLTYTKLKIRDLIMESFIEMDKQGIPLSAQKDGRIYHVQ